MLNYIYDLLMENDMQADYLKKVCRDCYVVDYTMSAQERMMIADFASSSGLYIAAEKLYLSLPKSERVNLRLAQNYRDQGEFAMAKKLYYDTYLRYRSVEAKKRLNELCSELYKEYSSDFTIKSGAILYYD